MVLGVGTGSTANFYIDLLAQHKDRFDIAVASSEASAKRLRGHGITVVDLNDVKETITFYVDGADEINAFLHCIKGGGAALTREKIVAAASEKFICIVDASKRVENLGKFPLPIEVIPMARSYVTSQITALGGRPVWREVIPITA